LYWKQADEEGIDLTGKIALVKYGGNFRGLKIKGQFEYTGLLELADRSAAQEAGAVGCLIFTDPGDDGEITEAHGYAQYPEGPARQVSSSIVRLHILTIQQSSVQRGSVQFVCSHALISY
jgi:N-acetylated-alpha-linked acidic dipeptidase